ncbi:RHS repeat-associated core domain-containing protein [Corallococcus sicarius]|uniref:RHS repeat-associated core domain-containing protein n=1 Tax=Corallococcus sicarius TaxID=2316726 RepID=A0A3A8NKW8_9BACT|nr:RHS repeat-associated core domain-containing protein [Corallococcus sicarius]RKH44868.1 hypothetical protein D7X12_09325 [Corallococcus sicarius]
MYPLKLRFLAVALLALLPLTTHARWYHVGTGRFLSEDPLGAQSFISTPTELNPWSYARGNPLRYIDPTGEGVTLFGDNQEQVAREHQTALEVVNNCQHGSYAECALLAFYGATPVSIVGVPVLFATESGAALLAGGGIVGSAIAVDNAMECVGGNGALGFTNNNDHSCIDTLFVAVSAPQGLSGSVEVPLGAPGVQSTQVIQQSRVMALMDGFGRKASPQHRQFLAALEARYPSRPGGLELLASIRSPTSPPEAPATTQEEAVAAARAAFARIVGQSWAKEDNSRNP